MFHVDDLSWIMLDLSRNDDMMKYMKCSYDNFDRFMIFDDYNMMNIWTNVWTLAVHGWLIMIRKLYVVIFSWFMLEMKLYVDLSSKLIISTCNMMSIWLIMLMECLVSC